MLLRILSVAVLALAACERGSETQEPQSNASASSLTPPLVPPSEGDQARVCRTAIADMNGHSPQIVKSAAGEAGTFRLSYSRPSDGKIWTHDCRIEGDRVIWRSRDLAGPGTGPGRWRIDPMDEVITFAIVGESITITTTFPGKPPSSETYEVK